MSYLYNAGAGHVQTNCKAVPKRLPKYSQSVFIVRFVPVNSIYFNISLIDLQGRVSTHQISAGSVDHAQKLASLNGGTLLSCEPSRLGSRRFDPIHLVAFSRAKPLDTVSFSLDLATLLEAGVTVKDAISALTRRETSPSSRQTLNQLNEAISSGLSLSAALDQAKVFPQVLIATVAASEQTGDLATGLSRYAQHQNNLRTVRDRVIGACVYPMLLMTVGSIVVAVLLTIVVPRFSALIESNGHKLPFMSELLMKWGKLVEAYPWVPSLILTAVGAAIFAMVLVWRNPETRKRLLQKIPLISSSVREFQHLQMYRTTAILAARGIPFHKALQHSMDLLSPKDIVGFSQSVSAWKKPPKQRPTQCA